MQTASRRHLPASRRRRRPAVDSSRRRELGLSLRSDLVDPPPGFRRPFGIRRRRGIRPGNNQNERGNGVHHVDAVP